MTNPDQDAQVFLNELLRDVDSRIVRRLASYRANLAQSTGVLPASAVPLSDPGFVAGITDIVGTLPGGYTDPTTTDGDLPYRDASGPQRLAIGTDDQVLTVVAGEPAWVDSAAGAFPTHATLWHEESTVTVGNALFVDRSGTYPYGTLSYQQTPANGDSYAQSFVLAAGAYTLFALGGTATNRGRVDWYVDGVLALAGQEWYGAPGIATLSGSITVATPGLHMLTGVVNGKHGSSSDYYLALTKYWIA